MSYGPTHFEMKDSGCIEDMGGYRGYDVSYKCLLVGESGVGKTAILRSLMGKGFTAHYRATVGIDFVKKIFDVDGARVQLEIWDTAGQERFRTITRFQYRGTKGLLLVYDITDRASFSQLNYWLQSIDKEVDATNKEPVPVMIVGNKADLSDSRRQVPTEHGQKAAYTSFVDGFLETSAKTGANVSVSFRRLAQAITELNNPKILNSYLTTDERKEKEQRKMSQITLYSQNISDIYSQSLSRKCSNVVLGLEPVKSKLKCACSGF